MGHQYRHRLHHNRFLRLPTATHFESDCIADINYLTIPIQKKGITGEKLAKKVSKAQKTPPRKM